MQGTLIQRNAASAVPVKSKATKTFNGRSPRAHALNGTAERTTSVGTDDRTAACSATLPSSHSLDRRPSEPTTRSRASSRRRQLGELYIWHAREYFLLNDRTRLSQTYGVSWSRYRTAAAILP